MISSADAQAGTAKLAELLFHEWARDCGVRLASLHSGFCV